MFIKSKSLRNLSFLISIIFLINLFYMIYSSFFIVKNQFTDIGDSTYVNQVRVDDYTKKLADFLTKNCKQDSICEVQNMLDFVTQIPYKINESIAKSPKKSG